MPSLVFLSSTFDDLVEHRKAVLYVLQRMQTLVEAMELFGSSTDAPLQVCLEAVDRSDLYIGIIGTRYGHTDEDGVSITQREYERAFERKKTIHIYLIDEEHHLVPPMHVDRGDAALRLAAFKGQLRKRHTCTRFESASDLAVKVGLDLVRYLRPKHEISAAVETMVNRVPEMLLHAGYSLGLHEQTLGGVGLIVQREGHIAFADRRVEKAASAAYLASALCRGDFTVLDGTLTFDGDFFEIVIALLEIWGIDRPGIAGEIRRTNDPMKFRLMTAIAGRLAVSEAVEPICEAMFQRYALHHRFNQLEQMATPVRDVVKAALSSMPRTIKPTIEAYASRAKVMQKWRQKRLFEAVLALMNKEDSTG